MNLRTLKFIVDGQSIKQDPDCDFSGLVPGTAGYLRAEFAFSPEWDNTTKVIGFFSNLGVEYEPRFLGNTRSCIIPSEALAKRIFKIRVIGKTKDGIKLTTNKVAVCQKGG